tara:strand:- start:190 stop:480 length:291 start_codon:yes stop_codon:yes gene_type:complete
MNRSECLISSLIIELDSLTSRINNINLAFSRTSHNKLRDRLLFENNNIFKRIEEINKLSEFLVERSQEEIGLSALLQEKCKRSIYEINIKRNLFFL